MTTMTHRLLPPADGLHPTVTVSGRTYSCAIGSSLDVPDADAYVLMANGWSTAASGGADTTANRPKAQPNGQPLPRGYQFHDTTLGINITWDGKTWRNPTSGAAV